MDQIHKRIRQPKRTITRREAINSAVKAYIRNNPEEYLSVIDEVQKRRALSDEKFAIVKDDKNADLNSSMRLAFVFPEKLHMAITTVIDYAGNEPFLKDNGEYRWFVRTYPQFFIPKQF